MVWFTRLRNWVTDAAGGTGIRADYHDSEDDNFATGINQSLNIGGLNSPTANIPFGGFKITGLGNGSAATDSAALGQVQAGTIAYAADSVGTDSYAITLAPAITAYATGQIFSFKAGTANTGTATLAVNGLSAITIKKNKDQNLETGDIVANQINRVIYDGTNFQLMSPVYGVVSQSGAQLYAADAEATDTYVITLAPAPAAYYTGMVIRFKANTANTGVCTINVNALGAKTLKKGVSNDLATGDILASQITEIVYDGTNFQLLSTVDDIVNLTTDSSPDVAADYIKTWDASASTYKKVLLQSGSLAPNLIMGGDFSVNAWQRGTTFTGPATAVGGPDCWGQNYVLGTGVFNLIKTADAPTFAQAGVLTSHCYHLDVTTAEAAFAAGEYCNLLTAIEGYDFAAIAQQSFTLYFWHKHTITGTYCVGFKNSGADRTYIAEYTQAVTDTWELATITVTASPSAGTWDYTTGVGLLINFCAGAGSTFQTTANAWQTGNYYATANQVNAIDNNANNFKIALVTLRAGSGKTITRTSAQERAIARRYIEVMTFSAVGQSIGSGVADGTTTAQWELPYAVNKRVAPTITFSTASQFTAQIATGIAATALAANAIGLNSSNCSVTVAAGFTAGNAVLIYANNTAATITINAQLV